MADSTEVVETTEEVAPVVETEPTITAQYNPPSKDEWESTKAALKKANDEAAAHRHAAKEAAKANEDATARAIREAGEAAEAKYKPVAVRAAAKAALVSAGAIGDAGKLVKFLDIAALEVNDDGEVVGSEEQVAAFKAEYPQFFDGRKVSRVGSADAAPRPAPTKVETWVDKVHKQAVGAVGR